MKVNVIVNKGVGDKNRLSLDMVDGGFIKTYGGMIAIGYKSNNREYFLAVTKENIKAALESGEAQS